MGDIVVKRTIYFERNNDGTLTPHPYCMVITNTGVQGMEPWGGITLRSELTYNKTDDIERIDEIKVIDPGLAQERFMGGEKELSMGGYRARCDK